MQGTRRVFEEQEMNEYFCLGCRQEMQKKMVSTHIDYTRRVYRCENCGIAVRFDDNNGTCIDCRMYLTKVLVKHEEDKTTRVYRCEDCGMSMRRIYS